MHVESVGCEHDGDDVLADLVHVALDRAEHDGSGRGVCRAPEVWTQDVEGGLHGTRAEEKLGDEEVAVLEPLSHVFHPGREAPGDDLLR